MTDEEIRQAKNDRRIALEKRIVRAMIRELGNDGFDPVSTDDGGTMEMTKTSAAMVDTVFSVDESRAYFRHRKGGPKHAVLLICGNGQDIISDWSFSEGDTDGFNAAMERFLEYMDRRIVRGS